MKELLLGWLHRFGWAALADVAVSIFASSGALWVCVEILDFFFSESRFVGWIAENWWAFLVVGLAIGVVRAARPIGAKVANTDIRVEVRIGSLFSRRFRGVVIVGSNATFDTSIEDGSISAASVQGQFTRRYYRNAVGELDGLLRTSLSSVVPSTVHTRANKAFGKLKEYDLGTMAKVEALRRTAYFVAITRLNENRVAESDRREYLDALPRMWESIRSRGTRDDIVCPCWVQASAGCH